MTQRIDYGKVSQGAMNAMYGLEKYLSKSSLEPSLKELVKMRASQINGCAYCIDMHSKDLLAGGEMTQRLVGLDAWREAPYYTDRERAALEWTEALTLISQTHADEEIYERVKPHFSEKELADLTWIIGGINLWNRVAIGSRVTPGTYQPPKKTPAQVTA